MSDDLTRLGDALEAAAARDLQRTGNTELMPGHVESEHRAPHHPEVVMNGSRRHSRKFVAVAVAGGAIVLGAGAVAATALLDSDTVAHGLPGGSAIFVGTKPSCSSSDNVTFECVLSRAPRDPKVVDGELVYPSADGDEGVRLDWTDSAELFTDANGDIAGGCRGQDAAGLEWTCYAGELAVQHEILAADLLGTHLDGPTVG